MKNIIIALLLVLIGSVASAQNAATTNAKPTYTSPSGYGGFQFQPFGFINYNYGTSSNDTTGWYVQSRKLMAIYTYTTTPLNHISAPPYSMCFDIGDTSWYMKVANYDSSGWYKAR